jgi:hypothetical protein
MKAKIQPDLWRLSGLGLEATTETTNPCAFTAPFQEASIQLTTRGMGNPSTLSLFADTLNETESPAQAMQAMYTSMLMRKFHDEAAQQQGRNRTAETSFSTQVFMPTRWIGFSVVSATIVVHLTIVAITTTWFARCSQHTLVGNSWQAVAQICSAPTDTLLGKATGIDDRQVDHLIQEQGPTRRYRVILSDDSGRRELVEVT